MEDVREPKRRRLHGRDFYQSIGSPKYVLAPMVDQSEYAWRLLTRSFMTHDSASSLLAYTPMFHSRLFNTTPHYRDQHFEPVHGQFSALESSDQAQETIKDRGFHLDGNPANDRPLFVQFCANDPADFLASASRVAPFCDAVDLNLGCPQGIARRGNYGAFLQEDWPTISKLISALHEKLPVPVTAKFRVQETKEKTLEYARMILAAGASIITVHGRQRDQKGHNTGLADWSVIRFLRDNLPPDTVIFANGNILLNEDIQACLDATGADGVMSAEGNLSDPSIFGTPPPVGHEGREYWRGPHGKGGYRMDAVLRRYMDIIHRDVLGQQPPARAPLWVASDGKTAMPTYPAAPTADENASRKSKRDKESSPNLVPMQAHLFNMLRPLVAKHTDIRDVLGRVRAGDVTAFERILGMVETVVARGIHDFLPADDDGADEPPPATEDPSVSSRAAVARCRRPWFVCQPYVRPLPAEALAKGALTAPSAAKAKHAANAPSPGARDGSEGQSKRGAKREAKAALKAREKAAKQEAHRLHQIAQKRRTETGGTVGGAGGGVGDVVVGAGGARKRKLDGDDEAQGADGEGTKREKVEVPRDGLVCG